MNKVLTKYEIKIQSLEEKRYEFDFEGDKTFFEAFEQDIVEGGSFQAKIFLEKSSAMMRLFFEINAKVNLVCDRSLEVFEEPLNVKEHYVYKFGDRYEVLSEDIEVIPFGAAEINLAQLIFDFLMLEVPVKKIHPDYRKASDSDTEEALFYSDSIAQSIEESKEKEEVDPRWAALKDLKNKS